MGALRKVSLPTYCFDKQRYWITIPSAVQRTRAVNPNAHPLLGEGVSTPSLNAIIYQQELMIDAPDFIRDYQLYEIPVLSGPAYWSALMSCAQDINKSHHYPEGKTLIRTIEMIQPLGFREDSRYLLQTLVQREDEHHYR